MRIFDSLPGFRLYDTMGGLRSLAPLYLRLLNKNQNDTDLKKAYFWCSFIFVEGRIKGLYQNGSP